MLLSKNTFRRILSCKSPAVWMFRAFGVFLAITLIINAVQAAMGKAHLAYHHYASLALCIYLGCWDENFEDDDEIRERF